MKILIGVCISELWHVEVILGMQGLEGRTGVDPNPSMMETGAKSPGEAHSSTPARREQGS